MVDILAIAFESRINLLFAEMQGISPIDVSVLHESDVGITTIVFFLENTIVETRIDHQQNVVKIQ